MQELEACLLSDAFEEWLIDMACVGFEVGNRNDEELKLDWLNCLDCGLERGDHSRNCVSPGIGFLWYGV